MMRELPVVRLCAISRLGEHGGFLTSQADFMRFRRSVYLVEAVAELLDNLNRLAAGEPADCRTFTADFAVLIESLMLDGEARLAGLTEREREVLKLTADGFSIKEVAFQVGRSHKTIEACRRRVMKKLGIHSVAGLTKYAVMEGLSGLAAGLQNGSEDDYGETACEDARAACCDN
jgi:DNA-binding NarL/FixJ family response regulator